MRQNIALVVDDDPDALGMVATILEDNGMTVLVASDGHTAIDLARRVDPDVILLDAVMPEMDGFETCALLKSAEETVSAPIIFMTGLSEPENIVKGLRAGGVDYITKPLVIDELIARMTIHMRNAKMIQSARAALDSSGHSILAFDHGGRLQWGSPGAIAHFTMIEGIDDPVSVSRQSLQRWLMESSSQPVSENLPLEIGKVLLRFIGVSTEGELLVKLSARAGSSRADILAQAFGLTQREAEVLYWLSLGKTNKDIADILSLSARTVNKHLEQVFTKMGVDNRTSAAVMADRHLYSL